MSHIEGAESVLLALLTLSPCPKTTLCSSPIDNEILAWKLWITIHNRTVYNYYSGVCP